MRHGIGMTDSDSTPAGKSSFEDAMLDILARPGTKTLSPPELAHAMSPGDDWHSLLVPIRKAAVALARSGRLVIYRKGKPADPNDFRGVYRLGLPRHD